MDAIYINQAEDDEKSLQVPLMFSIYSNVHVAVGWLGRGIRGEADALHTLAGIGRASSDGCNCIPPSFHAPDHSLRFHTRLNHALDTRVVSIDCILNLMRNPFWGRLWIFQETLAPGSLLYICGSKVVNWLDLFISITILYQVKLWMKPRANNEERCNEL